MIQHHIVRHIVRYVFDSPLFFGIVGTVANAIVAAFSILIWKVYRNQHATMVDALKVTRQSNTAIQQSNDIAKKSLIYSKRSWLIPEVDDASPFKEGSGWKVAFYISNTGSVPGVMLSAHAKVAKDPDFEWCQPTMFSPRGAIILPGSVGEKGGLRVTADVPAYIPEEQLLATSGARLSVSCAIKYKDVISAEWQTGEWETEVAWIHGQGGRWYNHPYFEIKLK